jgi:hypothetical protein
MTELAKRRAYWLTHLMREHGWNAQDLARHAGLGARAGGQLIRAWASPSVDASGKRRGGGQPRDETLMAVAKALSVCPSVFHTPIPN